MVAVSNEKCSCVGELSSRVYLAAWRMMHHRKGSWTWQRKNTAVYGSSVWGDCGFRSVWHAGAVDQSQPVTAGCSGSIGGRYGL